MESTSNVPEFNTALIQEYLKVLQEKYDTLSLDPFAGKARIAVRKEIEDMKAILAEQEMEKCWNSLDAVFGIGNKKPEPKFNYQSSWESGDEPLRNKFQKKANIDITEEIV